jgi:uncharacterized delta-60 repeat protein
MMSGSVFRFSVLAYVALALGNSYSAQTPRICGLGGVPHHPALSAPARLRALAKLPPANTLADPTIIDVMFLYTGDAVVGAGTDEVLRQRIRDAVAEANYLYTNSQVKISLNPVYMSKIDYAETGDIQRDLNNLGIGTGQFSNVRTLRDDHKADIVVLITEQENAGIGGLAWDIPPIGGNPDTAFLAIRRLALGKNLTLAHEIGHLCGCAHDREHAGNPNDPFYLQLRPYIFGYRVQIQDVTYIDVMAYEPGIALPYFANPLIQLEGIPLGTPEGGALPSDTSRTINETAPYVSAYRQALSRISFTSAATEVLQSNGPLTFHLLRTGDLAEATSVIVSIAASSTAKAGVDYTLPASSQILFAAGQSNATFSLPLIHTRIAGTKTLRVSLVSPSGSHGIGLQGESTAFILDHLPVVRLRSQTVRENAGTIEVTPTFSGPVLQAIPQISWRLASGTALAGRDFVQAQGSLRVTLANAKYQIEPIRITIKDDTIAEPDKVFQLIVNGTTHNGAVYRAVTNEIRILDDDRPGSLIDVPGALLNADAGFNAMVRDDHKVLVWGGFSQLGGVPRTGIALLNADGTIDPSFTPPRLLDAHRESLVHFPNAFIGDVQVLADGKVLISGEFARADGKPRSTLARLNADGSLDETFGANLKFDDSVDDMVVQPDGKILVGGGFENIDGERHAFIARLNADGTIDQTFAPNGGPTSNWTVFVWSIHLQPDGKILIGGLFEQVDGVNSPNLARLNPYGTFDPTFQQTSVSGPVIQVTSQTDGRIVLAGLFDTVSDLPSRKLARLNPDGSVDASFNPPQPNAEVREVITLPDGRLLVNGAFTRIANTDRRFIAMLNADGTLDNSFDLGSGPDDRVGTMTLHGDGSLYLPGRQQTLDGFPAAGLARVKFGPTPSAITAIRLTPHNESLLDVQIFPGGNYQVEQSQDLMHWTQATTFSPRGFSRAVGITLPTVPPRQFLRLTNSGQ